MRRASLTWIFAGLGAALVGFGAGRIAAPAPVKAEVKLGETAAAWKARDAARTRLEIRLANAEAAKDGGAARAEAEALAALDPFHPGARAVLRKGPGGALASRPGAPASGPTLGIGAAREPTGYDAGASTDVSGASTAGRTRMDTAVSIPDAGAAADRRSRKDAAASIPGGSAAADRRSRKDADAAAAARSTSAYEEARREMRRRTHEAIDAMFPHAGIAAAMKRQAWDGRLDQAIEDLRKLRSDEPAADEILAGLRAIAAGLEGGRVALADGRLAEADSLWRRAFEAERELLPAEVSSVPVREARRQLAQAWFEDGRRFLARDEVDAAVASWRRGLAADPSHLDLRAALQRAAERSAAR